jgi:hypothetical protein
MSARIAAAAHAYAACRRIHLAGEALASDCIACRVEHQKDKHALCARCRATTQKQETTS